MREVLEDRPAGAGLVRLPPIRLSCLQNLKVRAWFSRWAEDDPGSMELGEGMALSLKETAVATQSARRGRYLGRIRGRRSEVAADAD